MTVLFTNEYAAARDAADPLRDFRDGIPPPAARWQAAGLLRRQLARPAAEGRARALSTKLDDWATHAVEGHFTGQAPWMPYHELVREPLARVVGAQPSEVVAMNSLTANLHLMMVSFYRPTRERPAILIEAGAFPSDRYAVESQLRFHGFDPADRR